MRRVSPISSAGVPSGDDQAGADHRHAVGELLRLVEVVRRQEDRLAERAERADHLPGGAPCSRVEAGRRLVEEDELRVADERDPEIEPPLLASGERAYTCVLLVRETYELDDLVDVARVRVVAGEHPVHLADREQRRLLGVLEDDADPLAEVAWSLTRVEPEDRCVAAVAAPVALEDLDRGRLARPVRPQQAEHLARADLEAHAPKRLDAVVGLRQVPDGDRACGAHSSSVSSAIPPGGNPGSRPVSARAISEQSGW